MSAKFKIGIIGLGAIGTVHSNAYPPAGGEVKAICDILPEKLKQHGDRLGIPSENRFKDYRDLVASDIDGVSVCVPNYLHAEMAIAALRAGKNVLLEKAHGHERGPGFQDRRGCRQIKGHPPDRHGQQAQFRRPPAQVGDRQGRPLARYTTFGRYSPAGAAFRAWAAGSPLRNFPAAAR